MKDIGAALQLLYLSAHPTAGNHEVFVPRWHHELLNKK
jgi:hypothetical protein